MELMKKQTIAKFSMGAKVAFLIYLHSLPTETQTRTRYS